MCAPSLTACRYTISAPTTPDGDLKRQVRDLNDQVKQLKRERDELQENIAKLGKPAADGSTPDPEILEATPQIVAVELEGHFGPSEPTAQTSKQSDETAQVNSCDAVIYLSPSDRYGRFLQMVGRVSVSVFQLAADGKSQNLGQRDYSPRELRDAWRSGFMGTHYTLEVPLSAPDWKCEGTLTVKLKFTNGITGKQIEATCEMNRKSGGSDAK